MTNFIKLHHTNESVLRHVMCKVLGHFFVQADKLCLCPQTLARGDTDHAHVESHDIAIDVQEITFGSSSRNRRLEPANVFSNGAPGRLVT